MSESVCPLLHCPQYILTTVINTPSKVGERRMEMRSEAKEGKKSLEKQKGSKLQF